MEIYFLSVEQVLLLQADQIKYFGGDAGVRDLGLLSSAVAQAKAMYGGSYLHQGIYSMAAAYTFHLVNNHPFVDGNKRVGLYAGLVFLEMNGHVVKVDPDELASLIIGVASSRISKDEVADFYRSHSSK